MAVGTTALKSAALPSLWTVLEAEGKLSAGLQVLLDTDQTDNLSDKCVFI